MRSTPIKKIKNAINSYPSYTAEMIIGRIRGYKVVSFDIFDTLIKRNVASPEEVIYYAAKKYIEQVDDEYDINIIASHRIEAEQRARKRFLYSKEVTLDDVYSEMNRILVKKVDELKRLELETEIQLCYANIEILKVFNWCKENNKTIIIVSDIYYYKEFVEKLLAANKIIGYKELFISSEYGTQKFSGELYKNVLQKYKKKDIIHIGDDYRSDWFMAKQNGIRSIHIAKKPNRTIYYRSNRAPLKFRESYNRLSKIISGHIDDSWDEYYQYGYEVLGPVLYGMSFWIEDEAREKKLDKIFFVARDGKIMQDAYKIIFGDDGISNDYFYASRRATRLPYLYLNHSIDHFVSMFYGKAYEHVTYKELATMMCLDEQIVLRFWKDAGFSEDLSVNLYEYKNNKKIIDFFHNIENIWNTKIEESFNAFKAYLNAMKVSGKIGLVDIGWFGSLQRCINDVCKYIAPDTKIYGLYLGLRESVERDEFIDGFIPSGYYVSEYVTSCIEYPFMTFHGSVSSYVLNNYNEAVPVLADFEYVDCNHEQWAMRQLQEGALQFVRDFKDSEMHITGELCYQNLKLASKYPRLKEAKLFGDLLYKEDDIRCLAKPKSFRYYLFNINEFKYDFIKCSWKPGFLKRLFKLPLPYYDIIRFVAKIK